MSPQALENFLRDLPQHGTLVKDRGYRQVWKFVFEGRGYYLKFYPRRGSRLKRLLRGSAARREFSRLQALQRTRVPAPHAVAQLIGFRLSGEIGDAVILEAIEPATPLDRYVTEFAMKGEEIPNRHRLGRKVLELVHQLGSARMGHDDLHLGNMLLRDAEVYLLDGYAVQTGGLKLNHMMKLGHSVRGLATRTELQRAWDELGPGGRMPIENPVSRRQWRKFIGRTRGENDYFGRLQFGAWRGHFFKQYKYPRRWAPASDLHVSEDDWRKAWPQLWRQIQADELTVIKRGASGDVLAGDVMLGERRVAIIVKRPFKRYWYRYLNEIGRGSRAWRAWHKAWALVARDIPTAWPLLVMQKRMFGYITDGLIVFERVAGSMLANAELDGMTADDREMLMRRTGAILRKIDQLGLGHFDAKASNWIVRNDDKLGPHPVLVDVDGIRFRRWPALGISRLLRSMRDHPQYTPEDSLALCQGYAPFSSSAIQQEA
ncbi:MAG TPA: lipopolysaccharide kinase InaA family protein [Tepidisphaeraceae bacterium]|nr:lipopolysaccharide kinase InaA family protein [Tepidisphaeraceae bacterium]